MIVTAEVKARVKAKLEESVTRANEYYSREFKMPTIEYSKRGKVAGVANYNRYHINLNPTLLMENVDAFIARTVPHEMAHLIDYTLNPDNFNGGWGQKRSVHGSTWKSVMRVLGAEASRCHSYDTSNSSTSRSNHLYVCKTCGKEMKIGSQRHKRMQTGRAKYWMRGCGRHAGYVYQPTGVVVRPMAVAAQTPSLTAPKRSVKRSGVSKISACRSLYNGTMNRQWNINQFIVNGGCTEKGAATYYNTLRKENK